MGGNSAPPAPDPVATAKAQGEMNLKTANQQFGLNATNQVTPYGNLNYSQIGSWSDGTPHYQAETKLNAEQQGLLNQQNEFGKLTNQLGIDQTQKLSGLLAKPVDLNNDATEARLNELGRKRLDPILQQREAALETKLYNQGVRPGTEAWTRAMQENTQGANDAYTQLLLGGRGQAVQEALTARNQPINEITALMSGGQVTQPNFIGTPQTQVAPVDYTGLVNNNYAQQMNQYKADQQRQAAMWGAAGQLGGMAVGTAGGSGGWGQFFKTA